MKVVTRANEAEQSVFATKEYKMLYKWKAALLLH